MKTTLVTLAMLAALCFGAVQAGHAIGGYVERSFSKAISHAMQLSAAGHSGHYRHHRNGSGYGSGYGIG